jgi:zinc transport system ATP-binding protein
MKDVVIEARNASFSYDESYALQGMNLQVRAGQFVSVVGPNGGGKTTFLKLLLGLIRPTEGTVQVFGMRPEKARARIGYMPQFTQADQQFPVTSLDVVMMGRLRPVGMYSKNDRRKASLALADVGLAGFEKRPFSQLSGGQRQRVLIARALSSDPELLLLDEPTANLDFQVAEDFYALLRRLNERMTILLVSHDLGLVSKTVETVICLNRKCAVHPTAELTPEIIDEIYGEHMRVVRHDR